MGGSDRWHTLTHSYVVGPLRIFGNHVKVSCYAPERAQAHFWVLFWLIGLRVAYSGSLYLRRGGNGDTVFCV